MAQDFEKLLEFNDYEITDNSDTRAIIWCDKGSNGGKIWDYKKVVREFRNKKGEIVRADVELDVFVQKFETNTIQLSMKIVLKEPARRCFDKIASSDDNIMQLSELQEHFCDQDSILALIEAGWLKAEGRYSSITSKSNEALHSINFDKPLNLINFIDFGGFNVKYGHFRLIGYQGELRLLKSVGIYNELFDVFNKFGAGPINLRLLSAFRHMYLEDKIIDVYPRHKGRRLRLGEFYI